MPVLLRLTLWSQTIQAEIKAKTTLIKGFFPKKSKGFSGTKQNLGPLVIRIYNTKKDMNQRNIQQKVYL